MGCHKRKTRKTFSINLLRNRKKVLQDVRSWVKSWVIIGLGASEQWWQMLLPHLEWKLLGYDRNLH